jgi:hypothetical protein
VTGLSGDEHITTLKPGVRGKLSLLIIIGHDMGRAIGCNI